MKGFRECSVQRELYAEWLWKSPVERQSGLKATTSIHPERQQFTKQDKQLHEFIAFYTETICSQWYPNQVWNQRDSPVSKPKWRFPLPACAPHHSPNTMFDNFFLKIKRSTELATQCYKNSNMYTYQLQGQREWSGTHPDKPSTDILCEKMGQAADERVVTYSALLSSE